MNAVIDSGDRDTGDYDSTEVMTKPVNVWHQSQAGANLPPPPAKSTQEGRAELARVMALIARPSAHQAEKRKPVSLTCWKDTPQLYRKMIARVAGLSADVVDKKDRELSETEKAMLRSAIADMRLCFQGLVSL